MRSFALVFLGIGLIFLAIAVGSFLYGSWFRIQAERVAGVVTEVVLRPYADGNAYCPVIRYSVIGGHTYTHNSDICSWPASYQQGQQFTSTLIGLTQNGFSLTTFSRFGFSPYCLAFWALYSVVSDIGRLEVGWPN